MALCRLPRPSVGLEAQFSVAKALRGIGIARLDSGLIPGVYTQRLHGHHVMETFLQIIFAKSLQNPLREPLPLSPDAPLANSGW